MKLITEIDDINQCYATQREAYTNDPYPSIKYRKQQLWRLKQALLNNKDRIADAVAADFGSRNKIETVLIDLMTSVGQINYTFKHIKRWMRPRRQSAGIMFVPATAEVHMQPKGVIGIITPWNYPVFLSMGPLIAALAAGNRAMIKMSEYTPNTNKALVDALGEHFSEDQVALIEGELEVSRHFSQLPFDHLLFTGSGTVGKSVLHSAADNLVPVTLELGGKSPCILMPDYNIKRFARDFILAKTINAGQTCVAPDTLYCHKDQLSELITAIQEQYKKNYPDSSSSSDITSLIHDQHLQRHQAIIEDAKNKGATLIPLADGDSDGSRQLALTLVTECTTDMRVMQEEIFGPLLPIVVFNDLSEVISMVNKQPRPLGLYVFTHDIEVQREIIYKTHSGAVCINDAGFHAAVDDLPFGGIGASGMGSYHGEQGFNTFSHAKSTLVRGMINLTPLFGPPYGRKIHDWLIRFMLR